MEPGEVLRRERERAGLRARQVGEIVGVTAQAVGAWERGEKRPDFAKANAIDKTLGAGGRILDAYEYIRHDQPRRAATFVHDLESRVSQLERLVGDTSKGAIAESRPSPARPKRAGS